MTRSAALVIVVSVVATTHASAGWADPATSPTTDDDEHRDGCPAGYRRSYRHTDASRLGATLDRDSGLNPSQLVVSEHSAYFLSHQTPDGRLLARNRLLTTIGHGRINLGSEIWQLTLSATYPFVKRFNEDPIGNSDDGTAVAPLTAFGNVVGSIGARRTWVTSVDRQSNGISIGGIRNAFAAQLTHGFSSSIATADAESLASRALFDEMLYRPDTYGGTIEFRTEIVGCYEPFIHFLFQPRRFREQLDIADRAAWVFPVSAVVGLDVSGRGVLMFGYGTIYRTQPDANGVSSFHRVRFAYEYRKDWFAADVNLDLFTGSYGGTFLNVSIAANFEGMHPWVH
jgi:hypothetical protein